MELSTSKTVVLGLFLTLVQTVECILHSSSPTPSPTTPRGPIFLTRPPVNLLFINTEGASVPCTAFGVPAPELDWVDRYGEPVDNVPSILTILANNTLYFHPFVERSYQSDIHAGQYQCVARNSAGTILSRKVKVKAVLRKQYTARVVYVNDVYVTRGNTAVFKCTIEPDYVRQYVTVTRWTRSGYDITGDRYSILPTGELQVRHASDADSVEEYRCHTNNSVTGEERISDPARLYIIDPLPTPPTFEDTSITLQISQGEDILLPCAASGYPVPSYIWYESKVEVPIDNMKISQIAGNLLLSSVGVSDSGEYSCKAMNSQGEAASTVKLIVTVPLSSTIKPRDIIADVGTSAKFTCDINGYPVESVIWYKDGKPVAHDGRILISNFSALVISEVLHGDSGMYQCFVENSQESAQSSAQLSIGLAIPSLYQTFEDVYAHPGADVSLSCGATGNPTPNILWTLDEAPIPITNSRYSFGHRVMGDGSVISYVNISDIAVTQGGQYKCVALNRIGRDTFVGRINVYGVPVIRPMSNVTTVANDILVLRCHVSGYPIKSITWMKDGGTLPANHRQHKTPDGTLTVENIDAMYDSGFYMCDARNAQKQGMTSRVYVSVLEPPRIDSFHLGSRRQGDRVSLSCVVSSGDLPITIWWQKDGQDILQDDMNFDIRTTGEYSSLLSISSVHPGHNGNYTCLAKNNAAKTSYTAPLNVIVPPRWVIQPQDTFVIKGRTVTMGCLADGTPTPTVMWKKAKENSDHRQYEPIPPDNSRFTQYDNGTLTLSGAVEEDRGMYLCLATNGVGDGISKVLDLTVHVPVHFTTRTKNYTAPAGHNATLWCDARGDLPLSISWSFNGASLDWQQSQRHDVRYKETREGKRSELTIDPTLRSDTGFYVCTSKNAFGFDSITIQLLVLETPDAPIEVSVKRTGSREASVSWTASFDGNSPVTAYVIQYKHQNETWTTNNVTVSGAPNHSASLTGLNPAMVYRARVYAVNIVGDGTYSEEVSFVTNEDLPSGPPTNIAAKGEDSQSIKVTWLPPEVLQRNGVIQGYYLGYKQHNSTSPFNHVTVEIKPEESPEMLITNLKMFTLYTIRIQAYNAKGAGPWSRDINVYTLEDVPSQPPQGVQATPLSSQSLMVIWSPPPLFTLNGILQGYRVLYKPVRQDEDESDAMSVTTTKLMTAIYGLEKFTNYSIHVLAYTRMGEGVRSLPIYISTHQDLPSKPADIKALPAGPDTILVSWRAPLNVNGVILRYILTIRDTALRFSGDDTVLEIPANTYYHTVPNLDLNHKYGFKISAETVVGEGEATREELASTAKIVGGQIASFPMSLSASWLTDVVMDCMSVGTPSPKVTWSKHGNEIAKDGDRFIQAKNGSLIIRSVTPKDSGNYTCRAENTHQADEIRVSLTIQAPPKKPVLSIVKTSESSIQLNWRSGSNGGSKIQNFIVNKKKEHSDWEKLTLGPKERSLTLNDLKCGSKYLFQVLATNNVGEGERSEVIAAKTTGETPIMPPQSMILTSINSTFITLNLGTWLDGGCPIRSYDIEYQVWGDTKWETVESHIDPNKSLYSVDLHPETWYIMRVTAHNGAGSTECILKFATKTYHGSTIEPLHIVHKMQTKFYNRAIIMIPLCGALVFTIVLTVGIVLYCKRRKAERKYKAENASNLRRDLTAETSLMSDSEKAQTPTDKSCNQYKNIMSGSSPDPCLDDSDRSSWQLDPDRYEEYRPDGSSQISVCNQDKDVCQDVTLLKQAFNKSDTKRYSNDFPPPPPELLEQPHHRLMQINTFLENAQSPKQMNRTSAADDTFSKPLHSSSFDSDYPTYSCGDACYHQVETPNTRPETLGQSNYMEDTDPDGTCYASGLYQTYPDRGQRYMNVDQLNAEDKYSTQRAKYINQNHTESPVSTINHKTERPPRKYINKPAPPPRKSYPTQSEKEQLLSKQCST